MFMKFIIFFAISSFVYCEEGKIGDRCERSEKCSFVGGHCDPVTKTCQCLPELPVSNFYDQCGAPAKINESCNFDEQCLANDDQTLCKNYKCDCRYDLSPVVRSDGSITCTFLEINKKKEQYIDFAMLGALAGLFLMFIIICVVLQLFSRARWRENRSIFNTPNPRLMNASLLRESITENRRPSKISTKSFSRQTSQMSIKQSQTLNTSRRDSSSCAVSPQSHQSSSSPPDQNQPKSNET